MQALGQHPYFSRISYELSDTHPFLFVVQAPAKGDPGYTARMATSYTLFLDPVLEAFERLVAAPLALEQKEKHPLFVVAILASEGDFQNYMKSTQAYWHFSAAAAYDGKLQAAVVHESPFQPGRSQEERASSARHGLVHVLEQAYFGKNKAPVRGWLFEGLAHFLSRVGPDGAAPDLDVHALKQLIADAAEQDRRALLRPLPEMFTVNEPDRLHSFLRVNAGLDLQGDAYSRAWWSFYRQGALLVYYLHEAEAGSRRPLLHALLGAEFRGEPAGSVLQSGLAETRPESFDESFLRWAIQEHRSAWPSIPVDVAALLRAGKPAAAPGGPQVAETATNPAATPVAPVPPTPAEELASARIAVTMLDASPAERFALALQDVRNGRASAGLAALEELAARDLDPALRARLERERGRIEAWIIARDGFLARLIADEQPLQFQHGGKRMKAGITLLEAGIIVFEPGRAGVEQLAVEALDPLQLAQQMDSAREGWARFYPYVLGGDERWKRLMKDEGPEASALREDAEGDYRAWLRSGELASRLESMGVSPEARSPHEVRQQLDELRAMQADFAGLELAERKRPALLRLAQQLFGVLFDLESPWEHLQGRAEPLDGGRVRLTYEFQDPAELEDFEAVSYLKGYRKSPDLTGTHPDALRVEDGELRGSGAACLRTLFEVGVPLSVRYELAFEEAQPAQKVGWLNVGVCDDGQEHFAWGLNFSHLQVWDPREQAVAHSEKVFVLATIYSMELRHDGSRVTLSCDGEQQQELPCTRPGGAVFLWLHSEIPARVLGLVIEGDLRDSSFTRLREHWIEREAAALFPTPAARTESR